VIDRHDLASGTGTVVVTRTGARVSELRVSDDGPNVLYAGPAAVAGGDRLWPAPEIDVFHDERGAWRAPAELDPGEWVMSMDGPEVVLTQTALGMRMSRRVRALTSPPAVTGMGWAGYVVTDTVTGHASRSAWHLVMLPTPQEIYVRDHSDPVVYYAPAPAPADSWLATGSTGGRWKIGFAPPPDGSVLLAAMSADDPGALLAVLSLADPAGTYVDRPPDGGPATAVQVYDSGDEGFCELEHHASLESRTTTATVVAVWGPRAERLDWLAALPPG
jgi:hypothetical protein